MVAWIGRTNGGCSLNGREGCLNKNSKENNKSKQRILK
jgi:hypothetical protein